MVPTQVNQNQDFFHWFQLNETTKNGGIRELAITIINVRLAQYYDD